MRTSDASSLLTIAALRGSYEAGLSCNVLNIGPAGLIVGDAGTAPADRHDGDQLVTGTADYKPMISTTSTTCPVSRQRVLAACRISGTPRRRAPPAPGPGATGGVDVVEADRLA